MAYENQPPVPSALPAAQNPLPYMPPLKPYQERAKNFINTHPFCGIFFDMGLGKAIDDEAWIPTLDSMRQVKTLVPGDILLDKDGEPCEILAVYHHTHIKAFRVSLSDRRTFICCNEHLLPLLDQNNQIVPTELNKIRGEKLRNNAGKYRFAIPMNKAAQHTEKQHKISPRAIGTIISTATIENGKLKFTIPKSAKTYRTQTAIIDTLTNLAKQYETALNVLPEDPAKTLAFQFESETAAKQLLSDLGKPDGLPQQIPEEYLTDSIKNRLELLCGLLPDTDEAKNNVLRQKLAVLENAKSDIVSNILTANDIKTEGMYHEARRVTGSKHLPGLYEPADIKTAFRTTSATLAQQVQQLVYSLGFQCRHTHVRKTNEHVLDIRIYQDPDEKVYIKSIQPVKSRNMTCFTVSSPSHTYLANDYIPTHNTLITLTSIYERNPHGHILVIAPKNIARTTWQSEITKWRLPIRTKSFVCDENFKDLTRKKRLKLYADVQTDEPTMYFINRELLTDLIKHMPVINGRETWFFPHIIIDESQSFKSYKSVRFRAMQRIRPCLQTAVILSGTPAPKDLMDLWPQIYLLDMGYRLGPTITSYRRTFFRETLYVNNHPVKWEPLPGAEEEIFRRIGDIVISDKNKNDLPDVTYSYFTVYMEPDEWDLYKQFAKEAVMDVDCNLQVTAANRGVLHNKLAQLASGTIYIDDQHNYKVIHKHKVEAVKQIIEGTSGSVMVAYFYNADRDILLQEIPDAVLFDGTPMMLEKWNNGEIPILLIHPASSGHGLNFQYGGHTLIWYSIIDNLEYYLQTNKRLHRPGQTKPVVIHHIITDKTVDMSGVLRLEEKEAREQRLLDAVNIDALQAAIDAIRD